MTGFQRVIDILDRSIGGPDVGIAAHGAFWRGLTRDQFVTHKVFNRELLVVGRGADSNLVKSLRGEAPFGADLDTPPPGAIFPRMPFGFPPVADADIALISKWIDEGCPEQGPPAAEKQWRPTRAPLATRYDDIWFVTEARGWAVNSNGQILRTDDGGASWEEQFHVVLGEGDESTNVWLRCVGFATETRGWVGTTTAEKRLFETRDGGATWTPVANLPAEAPAAVCGLSVVNEQVVYASGTNFPFPAVNRPPRIMKTVDGGASWTAVDMRQHASLLVDTHFTTADHGWVVGGKVQPVTPGESRCPNPPNRSDVKPVVLETEDGGQTWVDRVADIQDQFPLGEWGWKIFFLDDQVGFVSLENFCTGAILKTTDGGRSWRRFPINDPQGNANLEGIGFLDEHRGWVGGWGSSDFLKGSSSQSTDGGATWTDADWGEPDTGEFVNRFRFVGSPPTLGYASGNTVYKYSDEPLPVPARQAAPPRPRLVATTKPTPSSRPARLAVDVPPDASRLSVHVWDRFADHVRTLADERQPPAGRRTVEWDVTDDGGQPLDPGYYIVRVIVDDVAESQMLWITD